MIDVINKHLCGYEIIKITKLNFKPAVEIYETNQPFFILTDGKESTLESCMNDIEAVPPNFDINKKIYAGIWENSKIVGILDLLMGYPAQDCIWIGFLLVHGELHGRKIGSGIVTAVLEAAKDSGYASVQLGVINNNTDGLNFWRKKGFEQLKVSNGNIIVMEKLIV